MFGFVFTDNGSPDYLPGRILVAAVTTVAGAADQNAADQDKLSSRTGHNQEHCPRVLQTVVELDFHIQQHHHHHHHHLVVAAAVAAADAVAGADAAAADAAAVSKEIARSLAGGAVDERDEVDGATAGLLRVMVQLPDNRVVVVAAAADTRSAACPMSLRLAAAAAQPQNPC